MRKPHELFGQCSVDPGPNCNSTCSFRHGISAVSPSKARFQTKLWGREPSGPPPTKRLHQAQSHPLPLAADRCLPQANVRRMFGLMLTLDQQVALTTRSDLLAAEAKCVSRDQVTWAGRLAALGDYGTTGGSAADRRRIVEALAAIERQVRQGPVQTWTIYLCHACGWITGEEQDDLSCFQCGEPRSMIESIEVERVSEVSP